MGEFAAAGGGLFSVGHCQPSFCPGRGMCFGPENVKGKPIKKQERIFRDEAVLKSKKTKQHREPLTFYFRYTFDAPLNESPAASFDQYLDDEHRVINVIFPDTAKTQTNKTIGEIRGIAGYDSSDFNLSIKGTIFSDRQGTQSWLKNIFDINLSFIVPPLLAWVPNNVMRNITESLGNTMMADRKSNALLLAVADYEKFKKEKLKTAVNSKKLRGG
ncbi:uncharacterized protein LOC125474112 isoform X2 [Pyrus x bretschneideri]|uniref:uncharacterized protein LOC125474112 isoform X2 n=1 Tax=Pyrus x bretschneideri TaxID=225117 RepID=UPI002030E661|nr:uncharacterized protein LOC125474112 isoform X2 [Pyrus x bretschneideri]